MWVQSLGWEDPLEEEMATLSGILAWKILWTEEAGWLQSMESKSHSGTTELTHTHTCTHTHTHTGQYYSDASEEGTQGVNLRKCRLSGSLPHQNPCRCDLSISA